MEAIRQLCEIVARNHRLEGVARDTVVRGVVEVTLKGIYFPQEFPRCEVNASSPNLPRTSLVWRRRLTGRGQGDANHVYTPQILWTLML